jgi:hypothetical protein
LDCIMYILLALSMCVRESGLGRWGLCNIWTIHVGQFMVLKEWQRNFKKRKCDKLYEDKDGVYTVVVGCDGGLFSWSVQQWKKEGVGECAFSCCKFTTNVHCFFYFINIKINAVHTMYYAYIHVYTLKKKKTILC